MHWNMLFYEITFHFQYYSGLSWRERLNNKAFRDRLQSRASQTHKYLFINHVRSCRLARTIATIVLSKALFVPFLSLELRLLQFLGRCKPALAKSFSFSFVAHLRSKQWLGCRHGTSWLQRPLQVLVLLQELKQNHTKILIQNHRCVFKRRKRLPGSSCT